MNAPSNDLMDASSSVTHSPSCAERFKNAEIAADEFWTGLNDLVTDRVITSDEQRHIFWESHSWAKQRNLVERCPHFDPGDEVWEEGVPEEHKARARELLNAAATTNIEKEVVMMRRNCWWSIISAIWFGVAGIALFSMLAIPNTGNARGTFIGLGVLMFVLCLLWGAILRYYLVKLRNAQHRQQMWRRGVQEPLNTG